MTLKKLTSNKCFDGWQSQYQHQSHSLNCLMQFSIFLPPQAQSGTPVPVVYWLSGLTCTDQNFVQKAGAQQIAAELGVAIVTPDTSPRGDDVANHDDYDLGQGAGFYLNATEAPWSQNFQMYDYIVQELPQLIESQFPVTNQKAISGHSMGGHGALVIALKNPELFSSVSAFSPISQPTNCPWGIKAFSAYLGTNQQHWQSYDAVHLLSQANHNRQPILIDQGLADPFLAEQLKPEALNLAAQQSNYPITLRYHEDYDHSYFFIASFIAEHIRFHANHFNH